MELLATTDDKQVWFQETSRPFLFDSPFRGEPYVCILFVRAETVTEAERRTACGMLIKSKSNCRDAVCAGHQCWTIGQVVKGKGEARVE